MHEIYINQHDESTRVADCHGDRNSLPCTKSYRPHERFISTAGRIRAAGREFNSRRVHHQMQTATLAVAVCICTFVRNPQCVLLDIALWFQRLVGGAYARFL
jgi:hypothetical protein